ncbi:mucin-5AC-like isoform X1 [Physella acuta]|uniref:mucin-5AC-like isoform X1 n=1 Tax=Physella acuta TaxID=109671 RepID=UPI0027DC5DD9|nr:mucin-5AC-like isoform X1 [Physella acuta]
MTCPGLVTVCSTLIFLTVITHGAGRETYTSKDGRTFYIDPVLCESVYTDVFAENDLIKHQKVYTRRDDRDCCYLKDSRNSCCLDVMKFPLECRCMPSLSCGVPTSLSANTTKSVIPITTTIRRTTPTARRTLPTTTTTRKKIPKITTTKRTIPSSTTTKRTIPSTKTTKRTIPTTTTKRTTPTTTTTTTETSTTTTTTTTTEPTTTVPPVPDYPVCQPQLRVLNGAHVTDICQYSGIANITVASGAFVVCNAVLALANVNGTYKETFITPSTCKDTLVNTGHEFDLEIGIQRYPIPSRIFTIYSGPNGLSYLDVNYHYQNLLTSIGECEPRACVYHDSTTSRGLDLSTCRLVSWGVSNPSSSSAGGLSVVDVALSPTGCSAIAPPSASTVTLCFKTTSGMSLSCEGDTGAPVYCMAPANGEWYVAGVTQVAANCQESTEFHVLSISSV